MWDLEEHKRKLMNDRMGLQEEFLRLSGCENHKLRRHLSDVRDHEFALGINQDDGQIRETDKDLIIRMNVPFIDSKDIHLDINEKGMSVKANMNSEMRQETKDSLRIGTVYQEIFKSIKFFLF